MIIKIKRQACLNQFPQLPLRWYDETKDEEESRFPKVFKSYILTVSAKSFKGHITLIGKELTKLNKALEIDTLIFLGDTETPWLFQNSDYKPVKEAMQFLVDNKLSKKFNGALKVDQGDLSNFTRHLSWLSRCNAALPYIYFMDTRQNLLGTICQYGNMHFNTLNKNIDKYFQDAIRLTQFTYLKDKNCSDQFSKTTGIKGRQIAS